MIKNENGSIKVIGWAENVRNLGGLAFITVRDIKRQISSDGFEEVK